VVAWPGVAMTADCSGWYKFTFPTGVTASNLIFNDGTLKTADLTATGGIKYYDSAWLAAEPANRCSGSGTGLIVYFKKPANWNSAVKIYYWGTTGTAPLVAWPGVAMTEDCGGWYKFTFPTGVTASSLIFTDGTLQTTDLNATVEKKYYSAGWLSAVPLDICKLGIEENESFKSSVVIYPNPVSNIFSVSSDSASVFYQIIGLQGNVLCEGIPNNEKIDVSSLRPGAYVIKVKFENGKEYIKKFIKK
jgi:hypothetical protein